jgi:hypothetical protein
MPNLGVPAFAVALFIAGSATGAASPTGTKPVRATLGLGAGGAAGASVGLGGVDLRGMLGSVDAPGVHWGDVALLLLGLAGVGSLVAALFLGGICAGRALRKSA